MAAPEVEQLNSMPALDERAAPRIREAMRPTQPEAVSTTPATISVIIPTFNEESNIGRSIGRLAQADIHEIIVSDGDSDDRTAEIAESCGATLVRSERGRGRQLNAGAAAASSDALLFLHADTSLPARFETQVRAILEKPGVAAGAFGLRIDGARRSYRLIEKAVSWRCRVLRLPYGDQGLFLRTETFERVGAFPEYQAMEDSELVRRLGRLGRVEIAPCEVVTDARPPVEVESAVYRIAQEALSNALTYGSPPVHVRYVVEPEIVSLSIDDAGSGLTADAVASAQRDGRLGLVLMSRRAAAIGAELVLAAPAGSGSRVTMTWRSTQP